MWVATSPAAVWLYSYVGRYVTSPPMYRYVCLHVTIHSTDRYMGLCVTIHSTDRYSMWVSMSPAWFIEAAAPAYNHPSNNVTKHQGEIRSTSLFLLLLPGKWIIINYRLVKEVWINHVNSYDQSPWLYEDHLMNYWLLADYNQKHMCRTMNSSSCKGTHSLGAMAQQLHIWVFFTALPFVSTLHFSPSSSSLLLPTVP